MSPANSTPVACPRTLPAALDQLEHASDRTVVLAGGTDLMVELGTGRTQPDRVIDIHRLDELRGIREREGVVVVGALTTCSELVRSSLIEAHAEILKAVADQVGAEQIKNMATIGGNLGTASPAADLTPVLFALEARVRLVSKDSVREVPVEDFVIGYRQTDRRPDELIESVLIPFRKAGQRQAVRKVGTRRAQAISKVVVALAISTDGNRIEAVRGAAGSVAPRTVLLPTLAAELAGQVADRDRLARAARLAALQDCAPIDDVRSTAAYRRLVLQRVLTTLLGQLVLPRG